MVWWMKMWMYIYGCWWIMSSHRSKQIQCLYAIVAVTIWMIALQYFVTIVFCGFTLLVLDSNNHQRHDIGFVVSLIWLCVFSARAIVGNVYSDHKFNFHWNWLLLTLMHNRPVAQWRHIWTLPYPSIWLPPCWGSEMYCSDWEKGANHIIVDYNKWLL